jgi:hypothetical protein
MKTLIVVALTVFATSVHAADLECAALEILTGQPLSPDNCFFDDNGDGIRDGTTAGITMDSIRAITNRADVLELATAQENASLAPVEIDRIAFDTGWTQKILADGTEILYRHRNSPYNPSVDSSNETKATSEKLTLKQNLDLLKNNIVSNKVQVQAIDSSVFTGTQRTQIQNLRRGLLDSIDNQVEMLRLIRQSTRD